MTQKPLKSRWNRLVILQAARLDVPASTVYRMVARLVVIYVAIEVGTMPRHQTLVQFPPEVVAEIEASA